MIAKAIVVILLSSQEVTSLVADRIKPVKFNQGEAFPMLEYATGDIQRIPCRSADKEFYGTLAMGVLAKSYTELQTVTEAIRHALDRFDGVIEGYSLSIDSGVEGDDSEDSELQAYYKRVEFSVHATQL